MQNALLHQEEFLRAESIAWELSEADKGQIYTRPEVVEFMLTTLGLNCWKDFENARILEPSCGEGEFVIAIVERLIKFGACPPVEQLKDRLLAVDLVASSIETSKQKVSTLLSNSGYTKAEITQLLDHWFLVGDFLLENIPPNFTHVIGNPPYVRVEGIPKKLLSEYRRRFSTMTDRADLYIPFYEKSLLLLLEKGRLSFICADRWIKNRYGRALRKLISDGFSLELYVDLYGVEAFESQVMTYPAITQIIRANRPNTVLVHGTDFGSVDAEEIVSTINGHKTTLQTRKAIVSDDKPWLMGSLDQLEIVQNLEQRFPLIEETGCDVFIGAATGANKIYIVDESYVGSKIESDRLLPVVTASELDGDRVKWRGKYLINTYDENGVVNLEKYPMLSNYLNIHKKELSSRHVARKESSKWFKTIDRVYKDRANKEKLLIPDIRSNPIAVYDKGEYHPNNSIYYICSSQWDLNALRVVFLSDITRLFIATYSTKVANGHFRFQSQHLRKLRLPFWNDLSKELQKRLIRAGKNNIGHKFSALACEVYGLNENEKSILGE